MGLFPDNNAGQYFVKLPRTLELTSHYEVGLAEIQFPNSYFNVLDGEIWLDYFPPNVRKQLHKKLTLPAGLYHSAEAFLRALNHLGGALVTPGANSPIRLSFIEDTNTIMCRLYEKGASVIVSDKLKDMLGLTATKVSESSVSGKSAVDLDSGLNNVYVYCDIVAARPVGDVMVPLLRTVPIMDRQSASVFRIYDKPHYVPLSRFSFDTLEVLLTTDTGKPIPFASGTSILTLHFRARKHFDLD
jgi:hypothetical protein